MKCTCCKKKINITNSSICNWCENQFCFSCLSLETHKCDSLDIYIKHKLKQLNNNLPKIQEVKIKNL